MSHTPLEDQAEQRIIKNRLQGRRRLEITMTDKTALTGGSRGLGRSSALHLADKGVGVVLGSDSLFGAGTRPTGHYSECDRTRSNRDRFRWGCGKRQS